MVKKPSHFFMCLLLLTAFFASGHTVYEEDDRRGDRVRMNIRGLPPLTGELLAAEHQYMAVLLDAGSARSVDPARDQSTMVLVYYETVNRLRVGLRTFRARDMRPGFGFQRLSLFSRHPMGINRELMEELLETYEQEDLIEIRR